MLTKEERDRFKAECGKDAPVALLCDDLDAKDAAIADWKAGIKAQDERIAELTTALDDAAHALADLTEQRDAALVTVRNDSRDISALQNQLAKAETALREVPCNCDENHNANNDYCGLTIARAYFAAKETP